MHVEEDIKDVAKKSFLVLEVFRKDSFTKY